MDTTQDSRVSSEYYNNRHRARLEDVLSDAIQKVMECQPADPVAFLSAQLARLSPNENEQRVPQHEHQLPAAAQLPSKVAPASGTGSLPLSSNLEAELLTEEDGLAPGTSWNLHDWLRALPLHTAVSGALLGGRDPTDKSVLHSLSREVLWTQLAESVDSILWTLCDLISEAATLETPAVSKTKELNNLVRQLDTVVGESAEKLEESKLNSQHSVAVLRRLLLKGDEAGKQVKGRLDRLQDAGQSTSRTHYLRSLSESIGQDPRPPDWTSRPWRDSWRDDWRRMYLEHTKSSALSEPTEGWPAVEARTDQMFAQSIRNRVNEGWIFDAAETYIWLSSVEAREPMARALQEQKGDYAAATYAFCASLAHLKVCPPSIDGQPHAYRNLTGKGGLTTAALVRPTREAKYFDERGWIRRFWKDYERSEFVDSAVVGFVNAPTDEQGYHSAFDLGKTMVFPPNTLFRLKHVIPPGEWEAPGGCRPNQRLLVVTCTFRLPVQHTSEDGSSKMCDKPTTLAYGTREMYIKGLSDVLDRPLLSLEDEWSRSTTWLDRTGRSYSLRGEWEYVSARVSERAIVGGGMGVRDKGNEGRAPEDFLRLVNEHIGKQRAAYAECRLLPDDAAQLTLDEVLAVRLYTGPGYQPVNDFLRQLGQLSGAIRDDVATSVGLTFTATTALLCSAIRKLSAVAPPEEVEQPLYRAVRGELPHSFWVKDKQGMICAVDTGFMSTSKNRETPIHYMGQNGNVLWELAPSGESDTAYHRGASVELLSQFPGEEEVLPPELT